MLRRLRRTPPAGQGPPPNDPIVAVPEFELTEASTPEEYWLWADELPAHLLSDSGISLAYSCCVPQRALIAALLSSAKSANLLKICSIGSGPSLLEWLLTTNRDGLPCICVDGFADGDDEWLIPPARVKRRTRDDSLCFVQTHQLEEWHTADALLLFCWPLLDQVAARAYIRQFSCAPTRGRAVAVIADGTCCPSGDQVSAWLREDEATDDSTGLSPWRRIREEAAATLGPPCILSVFMREEVGGAACAMS